MDTNNNRTVKLMIGGIAIVIAIALILLFVIWSSFFGDVSNENTAETITSNLGNYVQKEYKRDEVVVKYLQEIVGYLENAEYDELYTYFSDDFINYYGYNKEKLKASLQNKKILGNQLTYNEYSYVYMGDYTVYSTELVTTDKSSKIRLNIIEKAPNQYKLTLDDYLMNDNSPSEQIVDGVKLTITERQYFNNRVIIKANLTNLNDYNIYLNESNNNENIFFRYGTADYKTNATILESRTEKLEPNSSIALTFDTEANYTTYSRFDSLVVKYVKIGEMGVVTELVYDYK